MAKLEWTGRSRNFKRHAATEAATSDHLHLPPFMPWSTAMVNGLAGPRCPTINACADGSGLSSSRFVYEPCVLLTERLRGAKWLLEDDRFRRHIAVSIWLDLAVATKPSLVQNVSTSSFVRTTPIRTRFQSGPQRRMYLRSVCECARSSSLVGFSHE